jgi:hypothetical protein
LDLRRLRPGEWVALAAGVALLAALFLPWYGTTVAVGDSGVELRATLSGWRSFAVIDVLLAAIALVAIALWLLQATQGGPTGPVAAGVLTVVLGALAVLLVAFRLVDQPGPNELFGLRAGAWLGLAAAGQDAGGWLSLRDERSPGRRIRLEPEHRPAPPAT